MVMKICNLFEARWMCELAKLESCQGKHGTTTSIRADVDVSRWYRNSVKSLWKDLINADNRVRVKVVINKDNYLRSM